MKLFTLGLIMSISTAICQGQVNYRPIEKRKNYFLATDWSNTFKIRLFPDSSQMYFKYDSVGFSNLLMRSKLASVQHTKSPGNNLYSATVFPSDNTAGNYKIAPIAHHPTKVLHMLMFRPNRDMPAPSNLINSNGRSQYPYYLRANRYDWMIYRGN